MAAIADVDTSPLHPGQLCEVSSLLAAPDQTDG